MFQKKGFSPIAPPMPTLTASPSVLLDRKIEETAAGLPHGYANILYYLSKNNEDNVSAILNYIFTMKIEVNLSDSYRKDLIKLLSKFSNYCHNKNFKDISREDVISFLDSFRKTETTDPLHKWIGTYNIYRIHLLRFFKWLYSPDSEPGKRQKPAVVDNIAQLKRKETSIYKPSDLWTQHDDLLFLKYCPSKRDRCYHAMSRDLSCRPHEILKLKIRDLMFKTIGTSQYSEVVVNGKTGTRPIPLINSIPYLKDYLDHEHPQPGNPNAPLICGTGRGLGRHIQPIRMHGIYREYKTNIFPKLLKSPNIPPEDKKKIAELLKKPWTPYIRRHSALTEKSMILKEHVLRQHAGWTARSQMHLKYLHYFGNESSESLLEAYGIVASGQQLDQLKPKQCPNCSESNKPDSKFCAKCRMVLTYDAYSETLEDQKGKEDRLTRMEKQMDSMFMILDRLKSQADVDMVASTLYNGGQLKVKD
jgi:integrase/recombinase XerD